MVMTTPVFVAVEDWLFERLTTALGGVDVYSGLAPEDAPYPLAIFAYLDGADVNAVACEEQRVMTRFDYVVRMTDRSESWLAVKEGAAIIDGALQAGKGASELGGTVLSCLRVEPFAQRETDPNSGITYLSLGGVYRIKAMEGEAP
jgi:hypothetical protein